MVRILNLKFCLLFVLLPAIYAFNLDLKTKQIHRGFAGSKFGYSVDFYTGEDGAWVLVGAPESRTDRQPGVENGGEVFRCSTTQSNCRIVSFDRLGSKGALNGSIFLPIDSKSNQWFGETVRSSSDGRKIIACAPRYRYFYSTFDRNDPVGTCFYSDDSLKTFTEYAPCRENRKWGYHRHGYCMAGFSAAVPENDDDILFISAPGAHYWQGATFVQATEDPDEHLQTAEDTTGAYDNQYLGYALTQGDFDGDGRTDVAAGVPKGSNMKGHVAVFDATLRNLVNVTGEQVGSYFGSSLATADVNGDGRDDLVIGAPFYSHHERTNGHLKIDFEVGRVYVFLQDSVGQFGKSAHTNGPTEFARFGQSVAAAGDLNLDGFGDFAVGAPYDGPDKKGAIYIFNGKEDGFHEKFSQVILASEIEGRISTFGFSLAGGRDIDGNGYPDVVVGAYKSDRSVLLKSRPIVTLQGVMALVPKILDLENPQNCKIPGGKQAPCARFKLCVGYTGKGQGVPDNLQVSAVITLDADKGLNNRTLFTTPYDNESVVTFPFRLQKDREGPCQDFHYYVKPEIRDKLSPIKIQANYSLIDAPSSFGGLQPVLDSYGTIVLTELLEIKRECTGANNTCIPDLQISTDLKSCTGEEPDVTCTPIESFVVGSDEYLNLTASVYNPTDGAYEAFLYLTVPSGLIFDSVLKLSEFSGVCTSQATETLSKDKPEVIACDIGNPMPRGTTAILSFKLSVGVNKVGTARLHLLANSTNPEKNATLHDNEVTVIVPLEAKPDIKLFNRSDPGIVPYTREDYKEIVKFNTFLTEVGPKVTHIYQLRNDGPSVMELATVDFYWPMRAASGANLLYLGVEPIVNGNATCDHSRLVYNPDNIGIPDDLGSSTKRKRKSLRRHRRNKKRPVRQSGQLLGHKFTKLINRVKQFGLDPTDEDDFRDLRGECAENDCLHLKCTVGPLEKGASAVFRMESYLWINTLIKESFYEAVISSAAIAKVTRLPYDIENLPVRVAVASTYVQPEDPTLVGRGIPWWIWLIAALIGIVFLLLIALLLWRLGFFKRKRPPREKALLSKPPQSEYYGQPSYGTHL